MKSFNFQTLHVYGLLKAFLDFSILYPPTDPCDPCESSFQNFQSAHLSLMFMANNQFLFFVLEFYIIFIIAVYICRLFLLFD